MCYNRLAQTVVVAQTAGNDCNDAWWTTLAAELDYSHTWSIASATSIIWVVIAYLLTVADSLSNVADNIQANGCDYTRVHDAYDKANKQAFVADPRDSTARPTHVTSNLGLTIDPHWQLYDRDTISPDESRILPVFNYARTLSWSRTIYVTSLFYCAAWRKSSHRIGVDGNPFPEHEGNPIPENTHNGVPRASRLGNRDQIIHYCRPDRHEYPGVDVLWPRGVFFNMIIASFMALQLQWGTTTAAILAAWFTPTTGLGCRSLVYVIYGMLSTVVWILLLASSVLGYYAHHLPDSGLPIHDLESNEQHIWTARIPYSRSGFSGVGDSATIPLQHIQSPGAGDIPLATDEPTSIQTIKYSYETRIHARTIARIADWLRWTGKSLATANAIGIIANSIFQFASVYNNCYCDSSVYTWGKSAAFVTISPTQSDLDLAKSAWIGAVALGLTCCTFFVGTMYLILDSLPS